MRDASTVTEALPCRDITGQHGYAGMEDHRQQQLGVRTFGSPLARSNKLQVMTKHSVLFGNGRKYCTTCCQSAKCWN